MMNTARGEVVGLDGSEPDEMNDTNSRKER